MRLSVNAETVQNAIRQARHKSLVVRKKSFICLQNLKERWEFAKTHRLKTNNFWKKVKYNLITKYNIFGRRTVWRKPNTAVNPKN
ncbi:transposable element Tcb1 transposase [Trichonephila clavata]|uniref:Transposable element Tcb1 transposase n=1 Tax=Trichonephila clavata TaxID=2740835 RepID=A0A8X6KWU3_TRICU|nr:transposable element Tcb1 transposase [Trichonephila clavata]